MKTYTTLSACSAIALVIAIIPLLILFSFKPGQPGEFKIPVIINKGNPAGGCLSPLYMYNAWYNIELVAKFGDTLDLLAPKRSRGELYLEQFNEPDAEGGVYSSAGLTIIVDTVNELSTTKRPIWASYLFHRSFNDSRALLQDDTLVKDVQAFGIYIANTSAKKTAQVETQDGSAMMVVEAKNEKGKWAQVEYWSGSWCGNSYFTMALPPKHYLFTVVLNVAAILKRAAAWFYQTGKAKFIPTSSS